MEYEENEDPEDIVERERRAALIRKLTPSSVSAGWVSFGTTVGGIALLILAAVASDRGGVCVAYLAFLVGQIATLITIWRVGRLKIMRAGVSCRKALLLAIPGILISLLWMGMLFFGLMKMRALQRMGSSVDPVPSCAENASV